MVFSVGPRGCRSPHSKREQACLVLLHQEGLKRERGTCCESPLLCSIRMVPLEVFNPDGMMEFAFPHETRWGGRRAGSGFYGSDPSPGGENLPPALTSPTNKPGLSKSPPPRSCPPSPFTAKSSKGPPIGPLVERDWLKRESLSSHKPPMADASCCTQEFGQAVLRPAIPTL